MSMLNRRDAVAAILADRPDDLLVVGGLGSSTYDIAAAGDDARNFYLWGAMGGALSIGLGLALAQPAKRVLVITGDGELLMGLGSLATVGVRAPGNLAVAVLDNEAYGETGGQPSHTAHGIDLAAVALACRFRDARTARTEQELFALRELLMRVQGPVLGVIKIAAGEMARVLPERDGHAIRHRFRSAASA
jgi:thiamine pyrophosphate-dependent acetolactate synthase large subunit-like protein